MFDKNDKRRLVWLMEQYVTRKIGERKFCDEFYYAYDLELDHRLLSPNENKIFSNVSNVAGRFSEFEEDHALDDRAFSTEEELRSVVRKALEMLGGSS